MPIWGWVCLGLTLLTIALVVFAIIDKGVQERRYEREAEEVIGWLVSADPALHSSGWDDKPVQVLVALDGQTAVPDFAVAKLAIRFAGLKKRQPENSDEAAVAKVVQSEEYLPFRWFLIPPKLTGGRVVYLLHVMIERSRLSGGVLRQSFIRCRILRNQPNTKVIVENYRPLDESIQIPENLPDDVPVDANATPESLPVAARPAMMDVALAMYADRYSRKYVRKKLIEAQYPEEHVDSVVEQAWRVYMRGQRMNGLIQAVIGGVLLAIGVGITVASVQAAEEKGGGTYVLMTGLILTGVWNLFRGTLRLIGGR